VPEPDTSGIDEPPKAAFTPDSIGGYSGDGALDIPNPMATNEAAVHALVPIDGGWLAGGSVTEPSSRAKAALWHVGSDGVFASPELLPDLIPGAPSFVRDIVVDGGDTIAVGRTGAGREAKATVWLAPTSGERRAIELPGGFNQDLKGTTAERVLLLDNGTLMIVGRGEGPYYFWVVAWWSADHGQTWQSHNSITESYLEPLAATDGTRVVILTTGIPDRDGMLTHEAAVLTPTADGLDPIRLDDLDLMPGVGLHPDALLWDGSQFLAAFDKDGPPLMAMSADGSNWTTSTMELPGLLPLAKSVQAMVVVDGAVDIFVDQSKTLFAFRWTQGEFTSMPMPEGALAAEMGFVDAHQPIASDGHRVGFLAATWFSRSFLQWDGQTWTARDVPELPAHRGDERLDIRQVESTGGSELALLAYEQLNIPGIFDAGPAGLLWRPAGEEQWSALMLEGNLPAPVSLGTWNGKFVVGDYNDVANATQWWQFDPSGGEMSPLGTMPGFPRVVVGASDGMYVRVAGADQAASRISSLRRIQPGESETTSLWFSPDGFAWTLVDLDGENVSVCSNGVDAAASWALPDGDSDMLGTVSLAAGRATRIGTDVTTKPFEVSQEWRRVVRCAVGPTDVITAHLAYDHFLVEPTPSIDRVSRGPEASMGDGRLKPMQNAGATETWVEDITWDGKEWIAVGHLTDFEVSMDAVIWRSKNGLTWKPTVLAGGPGNQIAYSVTAHDGEIIVGGLDGQNAAIWRIPA